MSVDTPEEFLERLQGSLDMHRAGHHQIEGRFGPERRGVLVRVELPDSLIFRVELGGGPPMRFTREGPVSWLRKKLGYKELQLGHRRFDDQVFIDVRDREKAKDALVRGLELQKGILEAFEAFKATSVMLRDGALELRMPLDPLRRVREYPRLLETLLAAARAYDRVNVHVKVLDKVALAVTSHKGTARCAYCHEDVTGQEPDLVVCEVCGTVLHAGCHDELGKCPILGCPGTKPERGGATRT